MKNSHPKAFTLVEMLIVIVIIGILAAALIPRLVSARGRANDTARKADLQQIATALISYQVDNSSFPETAGSLDVIKTELTRGGLASIPSDPDRNSVFSGITVVTGTIGQYKYTPITKNGFPKGGFVLMAKTETENGSNYVWCDDDQTINTAKDFDTIYTCNSFTPDSSTCQEATATNTACKYLKGQGQLRYIYKY